MRHLMVKGLGFVLIVAACLVVAAALVACTASGTDRTSAGSPPSAPAVEPTAPAANQPSGVSQPPADTQSSRPQVKLQAALVTRVVDGDTAWVTYKGSGVREKVRFIGVDTPESTTQIEPYGKEASAYTKKHLLAKTVYLETDAEQRDRYGRLLAYVWMSAPQSADAEGRPTFDEAQKRMFNAWLARDGYAQTLTIPPNVKYADYFLTLQRSARENNKGLWDSTAPPQPSSSNQSSGSYIANRNTMKFHESSCRSVSAMNPANKVPYSSRTAAINDGYVPCKNCRP